MVILKPGLGERVNYRKRATLDSAANTLTCQRTRLHVESGLFLPITKGRSEPPGEKRTSQAQRDGSQQATDFLGALVYTGLGPPAQIGRQRLSKRGVLSVILRHDAGDHTKHGLKREANRPGCLPGVVPDV